MGRIRQKLDLGIPECVETPDGERLTIAGLIEMARTANTERGYDLYDTFLDAWNILAEDGLPNDLRANLAFDMASEIINCPLEPDPPYLTH